MGRGAGQGSWMGGRGCGRYVTSSLSALVGSQSLKGLPTTLTSAPGAIIDDIIIHTLQTLGNCTSFAPPIV